MNATYNTWYLSIMLIGTAFHSFAMIDEHPFVGLNPDAYARVDDPTKKEEQPLEESVTPSEKEPVKEQPPRENPPLSPTVPDPVEDPFVIIHRSMVSTAQSLKHIIEPDDLFNAIGKMTNYQSSMIILTLNQSFLSPENFNLIHGTPRLIMISLEDPIIRLTQETTREMLQLLVQAEEFIGIMITHGLWQQALQGSKFAENIVKLLITKPDNRLELAEQIVQKIKQLLEQPTPPTPPVGPGGPPTPPTTPPTGPTVPRGPGGPPSTPPAGPGGPTTPRAPTATVSGKAHESINKANSRLSSALRRLDAIKGYYKEIDAADRKVIKTKAENVFKDYESSISRFVQRIQQVKNEAGNQLDPNKLAPFNTFIELSNRLRSGIKGL